MLPEDTGPVSLLRMAGEAHQYEPLLQQLRKDFLRAGIPLGELGGKGPEALSAELHEKIYFLILEKLPAYQNLLYIVDVPENEAAALKGTDIVEMARQASYLILKREWKKVMFKSGGEP